MLKISGLWYVHQRELWEWTGASSGEELCVILVTELEKWKYPNQLELSQFYFNPQMFDIELQILLLWFYWTLVLF